MTCESSALRAWRKGEGWIYPLQPEERLFVRDRFFVPRFFKSDGDRNILCDNCL
jgi:hypothetical protein